MFGRQGFAGRRIVDDVQWLGQMHRFAPFPPQGFVDAIVDDAAQPGAEFGRFAQETEMFPRGNKSFLGHILALAEMADAAVGQRAN